MVVNPVVIAAAGFAEEDAVIFEAVFVEPGFGDLAVRFGAAGEKIHDMPFIVPTVEHCQCVGVGKYGSHAFGFFIGHIVADGTVDIDQEVPDVGGQHGADAFAFFVERFP